MGKGIIAFLASLAIPTLLLLVIVFTGIFAYSKSSPDDSIAIHFFLLKVLFLGVPITLIWLFFKLKKSDSSLAKGYLWGGIFWLTIYTGIALVLWLPNYLMNREIEMKYKADVREGRYQRILFKKFISRFEMVDLPYTYRLTTKKAGNLAKTVKLDEHSIDTLFAKTPNIKETYCLGVLSDTSNFYSLILFFPDYYHYPVLTTYSKYGDFISQEPLIIKGCNDDCGLTYYCSQTVKIDKNYNISSSDSIRYDFSYDEKGNLSNDSGLLTVLSKKGKVNNTGKIEMGKPMRVDRQLSTLTPKKQ